MGVCVHYWAIPPNSSLYARLQGDWAFVTLMASLFPYGNGVYQFDTIEPEVAEEILDDIIGRNHEALGPEAEARQRTTEFLAELERIRAEFPGIEQRAYMIDKCSSDIEQRLTQAIQKERADAAEFVKMVMYGDKLLAAHLRQYGDDILGLVSRPVVREGAAALERLQPAKLFPSRDGSAQWFRDNYKGWRRMYLEAAKTSEEILVGVT